MTSIDKKLTLQVVIRPSCRLVFSGIQMVVDIAMHRKILINLLMPRQGSTSTAALALQTTSAV